MVFWLARVAASFGFQMVSVAVGWQIYAITGRAFDLGLIGLVQFLPSIVLALPAGQLADQVDRRRVVLATLSLECLGIGALAMHTLQGHVHEHLILLLVFVIGIGKAFEWPSLQSLLPALVPSSLLPRAVGMSSSAFQVATMLGPVLGGLLYVAGSGVVYLIAALLYLMAAVMMAWLRYDHIPSSRERISFKSLFAGLHFIRGNKDVLGVLSLDLFAVLLGGTTALLPIFAKDILHTGPWGLGLLRAAPAVGALLVLLWLTRYEVQRHVGMVMFASVAGFGVATLVFAVSTVLYLSLLALCLLGAFDMVSMVIRNSLVQLDTPDRLRGRVNAANSIFINASNQIGEFESGMVAAWLGAVGATIVGGIGTLLVVVLWMELFPTLRLRQSLHRRSASGKLIQQVNDQII